ncbi:MAG: glycosyltransferase family 39 protein [Acidobacteria bacterium]|nr:glycosyltransferase family 39 protein [Acidobacteriota bacterium]
MGGQGRSFASQVLVFFAAAAYLGWGVWSVPLASGYIDPVQKIRPQDEALYSGISIGMAERGEWLTPRFLGRLAFVKPIMAFLPTAIAVKLFGETLWSLRLFSVLCGAGALLLLYRWQGLSAVLLLAANPLFFLLARRNLTDAPVLCAVLLTIVLWTKSPRGAGAALAWGVLTKSVAGAVPALFLWKGWTRVVAFAVLLILPWHLYQLAANRDWYWKEHVLDEHLQWGLKTPENAAAENHLRFYATRAWAIDPALTLLAPLAFGYCLYRKRYVEASWLGVSAAVLFAFGYRNATYLLPVFAAASAAAGSRVHWGLAAVVLGYRLVSAEVSFVPPEPVPNSALLTRFCTLKRTKTLLIDGVEDQFVASTMHFPRIQYMLPGDARTLAPSNIDFPARRIIVDAKDFQNRPEPEETVVVVRSAADIQTLIDKAPDHDILLKEERLKDLRLGGRKLFGPENGWVIAFAQAK